MDHETNYSDSRRSRSFSRTSSAGSSLRRRSLSLSGVAPPPIDDDIESETVSQAGDIGDRALHSIRSSGSGSLRFSIDHVLENGVVVPIREDALLESHGCWSHDPTVSNTVPPISPLPLEVISPLSTDPIVHSADKNQDNKTELPRSLEYISCLVHLAVFGILGEGSGGQKLYGEMILSTFAVFVEVSKCSIAVNLSNGVLTRYLLEKLFAPGVAGVTSNQSILYLDLPSNMVGSFLMGWWGVVFKGDISHLSDQLAIGLTTGYLGSLTTFSGWNQKMLDLSVEGKWVSAVLGFLIGLFLVAYSVIFGIETAKGFRWLLRRINTSSRSGIPSSSSDWRVDSCRRHMAVLVVLVLMLGLLWGVSGTLVKKEFNSSGSEAQLWLACMVGPLGVWIRWFLARLNGRGLGRAGLLKWVPFGTLIANVAAACVMAALSTLKKAVNTKNFDTIATGIQFGLMGCLSTVSTFIAEFEAMRQSNHPWRAYAYATITIVLSFGLGTLIYSVPVWAKGYG